MSTYPHPTRLRERNLPIEVYLGDPTLDFGMASIPLVYLRFYRYLACAGQPMTEAEAMALLQLIAQPKSTGLPPAQVQRLDSLRNLGLIFTLRPEDSRQQVWDVRSLFHNLNLVAQDWTARQQAMLTEWHHKGYTGNRPNYVFPVDYLHEIALPSDVCADIRSGLLYPVPQRWQEYAHQKAHFGGGGRDATTHA